MLNNSELVYKDIHYTKLIISNERQNKRQAFSSLIWYVDHMKLKDAPI